MESNQAEDDSNASGGGQNAREEEPGTQSARIDLDENGNSAMLALTGADRGIHSPRFDPTEPGEEIPSVRPYRTKPDEVDARASVVRSNRNAAVQNPRKEEPGPQL